MKTAVVLGGYGLIGSACARALIARGYRVVGVGRSVALGRRAVPAAGWVALDLSRASAADIRSVTGSADVVVNAAGALQDGARDRLRAIHVDMVSALVEALSGTGARLVQISAIGVSDEASTAFLRTKAEGDARVRAWQGDWVILRPGLVLAPQAYGGTALLRAAAAFPLVRPGILEDRPVQTVSIDDVSAAVVVAADGRVPGGTVADLVEPEVRSFGETVDAVRAWQGFAPWQWSVPVPAAVMAAVGRVADGLGWLGWRSPLRSTALRVLAEGVTGDPRAWTAAGGLPCRPLEATLSELPSTVQERWFARLTLLLPLAIGTLAAFWIASGAIGLLSFPAAMEVLTARGLPHGLAGSAVAAGSVLDLALGAAILHRPSARAACLGMIALSAGYLLGATAVAPDLWADPLGPLVKVFPSLVLALFVAAFLDPR